MGWVRGYGGNWEHGGEGEREEGVEGEKGRERGKMWRREMRRGRLREAVAKLMCRGEAFGWPCYAVTSGLVVLCLCVVEPINSIISIIRTRFVFKLWSLPCGFNCDLFGLNNPDQCLHYLLCSFPLPLSTADVFGGGVGLQMAPGVLPGYRSSKEPNSHP